VASSYIFKHTDYKKAYRYNFELLNGHSDIYVELVSYDRVHTTKATSPTFCALCMPLDVSGHVNYPKYKEHDEVCQVFSTKNIIIE
jgi:hypothetical protein